MSVFVINQRNQPLMPCSHRKARLLLKQGKTKIIKSKKKLTMGKESARNWSAWHSSPTLKG